MKRVLLSILILSSVLVSCSRSSKSSGGNESSVQDLELRQRVSGTISAEGEVDWYRFHAVESNNVLQVRCTSETLRPDVDLLVTVYQEDGNGNKVPLYGDHAPESGASPANLTLNAYIDQPRDIFIAVRDLMDDESSREPYYLSVDYSASADDNNNFSQATPLTINASTCPTGSIGSVGDVDCYTFTSTGGIYDVGIVFSPLDGSPVKLSTSLYNGSGTLIESRSANSSSTSHLIHYLSAGKYYIDIRDQGKDHFDSASTYQLCVGTSSGAEANGNDTFQAATLVNASLYDHAYPVNGSLDYSEDRDYYRIAGPAAQAGFKVLHVSFSAATAGTYQISILNSAGVPVMTHTYNGGSAAYHTQVKVEDGDYYLLIYPGSSQAQSQARPYTTAVTLYDVIDPAEVPPNGNDTIQTADALAFTANHASATLGKVSYRGDVDWYSVTIPAHGQPQVLEVYLTAPVSEVEYCVDVMGTQLEKTLFNNNAETIATNLKTSLLIPANSSPAVYTLRVRDYQYDEGFDTQYAIRADLKNIPVTVPAAAAGTRPNGSAVQYYSEASESSAATVTLEYNSVLQKTFPVNTSLLNPAGAAVQPNTPSAGLTTVTYPWIAGYIDYQGDQDWFQMNFQPLDASVSWYYEIFVDIYAPASDVEYVWKFYPDRNDNAVVADRTSGYDGFIASAGDTGITQSVLNRRTPADGESGFWVGNPWRGPAYFSICDFNYLVDQSGNANHDPDEDWGGYEAAPYYYRVTLVYHPGVSFP